MSKGRFVLLEGAATSPSFFYSHVLIIGTDRVARADAEKAARTPLPAGPLLRWWNSQAQPPELRSYGSQGTMDGSCWFVTIGIDGRTTQAGIYSGSVADRNIPQDTRQVLGLLEPLSEFVHE